jgi:hypothetical protein
VPLLQQNLPSFGGNETEKTHVEDNPYYWNIGSELRMKLNLGILGVLGMFVREKTYPFGLGRALGFHVLGLPFKLAILCSRLFFNSVEDYG